MGLRPVNWLFGFLAVWTIDTFEHRNLLNLVRNEPWVAVAVPFWSRTDDSYTVSGGRGEAHSAGDCPPFCRNAPPPMPPPEDPVFLAVLFEPRWPLGAGESVTTGGFESIFCAPPDIIAPI